MGCKRSILFLVPLVLILALIVLFHGMVNRPETRVWTGDGWPFRTPSSSTLKLAADLMMVGGSISGISSAWLWYFGKSSWKRVATCALAVFTFGLTFNAIRTSGAIGSILGEGSGELVLLLEGIALVSWFGFSICIAFRDRKRFERCCVFLVACFAVLTSLVLILGLSGLASRWVYGGINRIEFWRGRPVIQDSYWDSVLARTSWNYLLLFLIPLTIEGWRRFSRGLEDEIRKWFASLMLVSPVIVLVALLTQISMGAYWHNASHRIWPLWLALIACVYLILIRWGRWTGTEDLSMIASAASFSLFAAGVWLLARGPGLYWLHGLFPDLRTIWVPIIRYVVSSCLIFGGLAGIFASQLRLGGKVLAENQKTLIAWIPNPLCFSGILLLAILAEYMIRLYLAYRVLLPPVTLFPQIMITASIVAMIGILLASRQLANTLPMGPRLTISISRPSAGFIHPN